MLVMPVAIVVAAPLAGTFADRVSPRAPATADTSLALVVAVMAVYGVGAGFFQSPRSVRSSDRWRRNASVSPPPAWPPSAGSARSSAFRLAFAVLAVVGVLAVLASWLRGPAEPAPGISATAGAGRAGVQ